MAIRDNGSVVSYKVNPQAARMAEARAMAAAAPLVDPIPDQRYLFPGQYDISIYGGDTYEWWFVLEDQDTMPINIENWRFKAEIRTSAGGQLQAAMQETARDAGSGVVAMRLTSQQSRQIASSGVWDLEAITPNGWVRTILYGTVTLTRDVTNGFVDYSTQYGSPRA